MSSAEGPAATEQGFPFAVRLDVDDLLEQLDAQSAARKKADLGRPSSDAALGIVKAQDVWSPGFRPKPSHEEVKKLLEADGSRNFRSYTKATGGEFVGLKRLRPKVLDEWTQSRLVMPDRTFAKAPSQCRFHAQPEEFPAAGEELLTEGGKKWLEKQRREMPAEFKALKRVDKAQKALDDITLKKAIARDIMLRENLEKPQISAAAKSSLNKVRKAVATTVLFNKLAGINNLAEEEERLRQNLERAKSAKVLRIPPDIPETRARHTRNWAGPDRTLRHLAESTPWREKDDDRELAQRRLGSTM